MKKISSLEIGKARRALEESGIVKDGKYQKVFKGYISSFGASVAQAGLLPTIIFYENKSEQAKDRPKVIDALKMMLKLKEEYKNRFLTDYLLQEKKAEDQKMLNEVTDALVSLKLALRMFKEEDENN